MLNKVIGVIVTVIVIIIFQHNESYAFDRLDQDTPLTAPTQQTCTTNTTSSTQLCWKDGSNCLVGGSVTPVVDPAEMAAIASDQQSPSQITATVESTDQTNSTIPEVSPSSVPEVSTNGTSLNADVIFSMINQYRTSVGLPAFMKDGQICSIASSRAPELYNEIMVTHTMHKGFYARNLPYFATENIIYMNSEQAAVNWWLNEPIHHAAIVSSNKYSCVACSGNSCSEIFTSYQPK